MGLLQKFKDYRKSRFERRVERAARLISHSKAIKEDRWGAIDFLSEIDDPAVSVPILLKRFEYSLEHGINDTKEKEAALEGITKHADKAVPLLQQHLAKTTRIAWPIKALKQLGSEEQVVEALKGALNFGDISFDQSQVDKNYDILCYLVDFQLGDFAPKLRHFLNDQDERVRFACVEVLIEQNSPEVASSLESFLNDDSSENTRIRRSVLEAFAEKKWTIKNMANFAEGRIAPGFYLEGSGRIIRQN